MDNFERDLGVLPMVDMTINDGVRSHVGVAPQRLGSRPRLTRSSASLGVGFNGRFAVLAEEDSDDEAMPGVKACRRRVTTSPSFPPTEADPVRPKEVDMESASEPCPLCSSRKRSGVRWGS